jgi:hypothetical protein
MTNKVNSTTLTFTAVDGEPDFMLNVEWEPSLAAALEAVGGDEDKLPPSHKMMLLIVGKVLSPSLSFGDPNKSSKDEVSTARIAREAQRSH